MIVKRLSQLRSLLKRRNNAKQIGVAFTRAKDWDLPKEILFEGKKIELDLIRDKGTSSAFYDILITDCYGMHYFRKILKQPKTIVDIGANQGLFTLFARIVFPEASIFSYEPNPDIQLKLSRQAYFANAKVYPFAVGGTDGKISLKQGTDTLHGKSEMDENGEITQVSFASCLQYAGDSINLLKLDCEGAEWEILEDMESLKKVGAITLEYHLDNEHLHIHKRDHNTIIRTLETLGFSIIHHSIDNYYWGIAWAVRAGNNS